MATRERNPGPGDPFPHDVAYDVVGGGTFRPADYLGKKAILITTHLVDDGPVSWLPDPFKRLKWLQEKYRDDLLVAVMPEYAHLKDQDQETWRAVSKTVRKIQQSGDLRILIEKSGTGSRFGHGDFPLYKALNPEGIKGWWLAVLIDRQGRIVWSSYQPYTRNAEHVLYESSVREAVVRHLDPSGYGTWRARVPQDWVKQKSPWGVLEIEDFERYGDMGDYHVSRCWTDRPEVPYKGELVQWPARTGYRALAVTSWMRQGSVFGFPYYYGYRQVAPGAPVCARHEFPGEPRVGVLSFFLAKFPQAVMFDYFEGRQKRKGLACQIEGAGGEELRIAFLGDGRIGGQVQTDVRWNATNTWNRVSFHVDPVTGTRVFLGHHLIAEAPKMRAVTGMRFEGVQTGFVDEFVMVPKCVSPEELDRVIAWVDEHALERPHVTPLEREREIAQLTAKAEARPKVLRVNWGCDEDHTDKNGDLWRAQQTWLRGTFGYLDGDDYTYPTDVMVAGSSKRISRTVRYSFNRLRFTVPNGAYTLRVHAAQPFAGPHPALGHTNHGAAMPGWPYTLQIEIHPDSEERVVWKVTAPYRRAVVHEKKGIRVTGRLLDLRFNFHNLPHVAATELIQETIDPGEIEGIPDWPTAFAGKE